MITTIVLAAGQGRRLGGPKALLAWRLDDGRVMPLAAAHADQRLAAESDHVRVVARRDVVAQLAPWLPAGATALSSTAEEALGPAGSLAAVVSAGAHRRASCPAEERDLRSNDDVVLITPVDNVPAKPSTVSQLVCALRAGQSALAARPRCGGRGGHPVAVRPELLERYRDPAPPPLRELLHGLADRLVEVPVDDAAVLVDIDTPADLAACGQGPARFFPAAGAPP